MHLWVGQTAQTGPLFLPRVRGEEGCCIGRHCLKIIHHFYTWPSVAVSMDNRINLRLSLELANSHTEKHFLLATHVLAISAALACDLAFILKAALIAIVTCNLLYTLRNNNTKAVTQLVYGQEKGWQLIEDGKARRFRLSGASITTRPVIILNLEFLDEATATPFLANKTGLNRSRQILIPADSLSPENYRRLAVALQTTWQAVRRGK